MSREGRTVERTAPGDSRNPHPRERCRTVDDEGTDGDGEAVGNGGDANDGYRLVRVDDLPDGPSPATGKKEVDEAVGATAFGVNVYDAGPGELLPWGRHRHPDHEELFYVVAGRLAVETPDRTYEVGPGEAFYVPPDHPNAARATGDDPARVVAVGAPKAADAAVVEEYCEACDAITGRDAEVPGDDGSRTVALACADCGAETRRF